MKTKNVRKTTLSLNKETIAQLKESHILGGAQAKTRTYCPGGCSWTYFC